MTAVQDRRALRSVGLQFWINGMIFASFIPRLPEIRHRLDLDLAGVGLLLTLGTVGGLVASAACGRLIERLGSKRVMTAATLGLVAMLPLIGLAPTVPTFVVALATLQFFDALADVAMNLQASWLSARRSSPVMNRMHGLWSVGTVVGGLAATIAASRIGLATHLVIVSVVLAATLAYVTPGLLAVDPGPDQPPGGGSGWQLRTGLLFAVLAIMAIAVEIVPADWAALRLTDDLGVTPGRAGIGYVAVTLGMVVGRFGGDATAVRLGPTRLQAVAAIVSGVGLAAATLGPGLPLTLPGLFLAGLGAAVMFPALYDQAARAPGRPGAMLGAMTAGIRVGAIGLPLAVGTAAATDRITVGGAMALVTLPAAAGLLAFSSSGTGARP